MRPRPTLPLLAAAALAALSACKSNARPPALGETISIAQPGGGVAQLFAQGTVMPASATEAFTTAKDDEKRLVVNVVRGNGRKVEALGSEGWWAVDGVTPGPAGTAKVQITFELDAQGQLSVAARQEERKLAVKRLEKDTDKLKPSPLLEPDDEEDSVEDE